MGLATDIDQEIDTLLTTTVDAYMAELIAAMTPVTIILVTLYVIFIGYGVMRGTIHDPINELMWKTIKIVMISAVALNVGTFNDTVVKGLDGLQSGFATTADGQPASVPEKIDDFAEPYDEIIQGIADLASNMEMLEMPEIPGFSLGGWSSLLGGVADMPFQIIEFLFTMIGMMIAIIIVFCAQVVLFVIALGYYLLATISLKLLLAFGPLFIFCAIFPATQRFFENWLSQVLNYTMVVVLLAMIISMLSGVAENYAQDTLAEVDVVPGGGLIGGLTGIAVNVWDIIKSTLVLLLVSVVLGIIILNVTNLATALTGGFMLSGHGSQVIREQFRQLRRRENLPEDFRGDLSQGPGTSRHQSHDAAASHSGIPPEPQYQQHAASAHADTSRSER